MSTIPKEWLDKIDTASESEKIYEPKYGGKDHSGYDTMMKYEINYERMDAFENGAKWMYEQLATDGREELEKENGRAFDKIRNNIKPENKMIVDLEIEVKKLQSSLKEKENAIISIKGLVETVYLKQIEELKAELEAMRADEIVLKEYFKDQLDELTAENERLKDIILKAGDHY